jgi:hypothetical protein
MTKPVFAFVCLAIGCFAGATLPAVTAQSFAPNPKAQRWEGYCRVWDESSKGSAAQVVNGFIWEAGAAGFEPVGVAGSQTVAAGMICFKRPFGQ